MQNKIRAYEGLQWRSGQVQTVLDALTIEHPLSIYINQEIFSLTMQTPGDELMLACGMLFTEGVYRTPEIPTFRMVSENRFDHIDQIWFNIPTEQLNREVLTKRTMLSSSSCGICGTTELPIVEGHLDAHHEFTPERVWEAMQSMAQIQNAYLTSGGCHGAAAFDTNGNLLSMGEDIGRHNAVDKTIGSLLFSDQLTSARLLTVSGRVSYEIVYKCFAAGIPHLAAVSAPSSLAVDYCKELGIRLYGFCRENRMTRYA
jgi:FdhD protein